MRSKKTCPSPVKLELNRRKFLQGSLTACVAGAVGGLSHEEHALMAKPLEPRAVSDAGSIPAGRIGDVVLSCLICGGNLISGYAHSRDLIYVSPLLSHYFTDEKIMETWEISEEHGINAMIVNPNDERAVALFKRYRKERGGEMKWLAQAAPRSSDYKSVVLRAVDDGASGVFLVGNLGDQWTFNQRIDRIGAFVETVKETGVIAGVAGHSVEMLEAVEAAQIRNDFFMKTIHPTDYWSSRRPDKTKHVIENYAVDNYYDLEPDKTASFMKNVKKPWIAYKVLAAGAIHPRAGFEYAFRNGADFLCVGMFDFQIAEDAILVKQALESARNRARVWRA